MAKLGLRAQWINLEGADLVDRRKNIKSNRFPALQVSSLILPKLAVLLNPFVHVAPVAEVRGEPVSVSTYREHNVASRS